MIRCSGIIRVSFMRHDHTQAILLRRGGKSYRDIEKILGIPRGTLCYWFRDNKWSQDIKLVLTKTSQIKARGNLRLMALANKTKWERWHQECRDEAEKEFPELRENTLFIAGLMLYWGEGDKGLKNGIVRICNSDPEMINLFHAFLKSLGVDNSKIVLKLTIYPDLNDRSMKSYWSKVLNIPLQNFRKSSTIIGKHPNRILSYGVCSIEVYSRKLKEKIFMWLRLYIEHINKNNITGYNAGSYIAGVVQQ